jgi:hypothetical protein
MTIAAEPALFAQLSDLLASLDAERDALLARGSDPPEPPGGLLAGAATLQPPRDG